MNQFKFYIPLTKNSNDFLTGIASTLAVDRDSEKMSANALADMQREIINNGVNLFGNHEHDWENTLGVIKEAKIENNELKIGIRLDDSTTNPKVPALLNKLKRGIKLGLSVGGAVTKEKTEYDREQNRRVKVIDGVKLYEISVVGIPSNSESLLSIPQAIMKSAKKSIEKSCPLCFSKMKKECPVCFYKGE
jgi:HK97 family phage prohead protease